MSSFLFLAGGLQFFFRPRRHFAPLVVVLCLKARVDVLQRHQQIVRVLQCTHATKKGRQQKKEKKKAPKPSKQSPFCFLFVRIGVRQQHNSNNQHKKQQSIPTNRARHKPHKQLRQQQQQLLHSRCNGCNVHEWGEGERESGVGVRGSGVREGE